MKLCNGVTNTSHKRELFNYCYMCFVFKLARCWDGQKTKLPPPAEMLNEHRWFKFSGEFQTALLNWFRKAKKEVIVSLPNFLCILISS